MEKRGFKEYLGPSRKNVIIIYFLYVISCLLTLPPLFLLGFVMSYVNKDVKNHMLSSHYSFLNGTFFICVFVFILWLICTILLALVFAPSSWFLILLFYLWFFLRIGIGLKYITDSKEHPKPSTLWIGK